MRQPSSLLSCFSAALISLVGWAASAQEPVPPHARGDLYLSLKETINVGADLFNKHGDHAGCFRVYQGALIAIKPFLSENLQGKIDDGFREAGARPSLMEGAFVLRKVIDEIREAHKPAKTAPKVVDTNPEPIRQPERKVEERKVEERKVEDKIERKIEEKIERERPAPEDKKASASVAAPQVQLTGTVHYKDRPLPGDFVITLTSESGSKDKASLAQGQFRMNTALTPGKYRVSLEPAAGATQTVLPARLLDPEATPVVFEYQEGQTSVILYLPE